MKFLSSGLSKFTVATIALVAGKRGTIGPERSGGAGDTSADGWDESADGWDKSADDWDEHNPREGDDSGSKNTGEFRGDVSGEDGGDRESSEGREAFMGVVACSQEKTRMKNKNPGGKSPDKKNNR